MKISAVNLKRYNRLDILRFLITAAFLAGVIFSRELWFPIERTFPRAPIVFALPGETVAAVERMLCVVFVGSLIVSVFASRWRAFLTVTLISLAALIFFDQMRLQPWVYQYFLLLTVLTLGGVRSADEASANQTPTLCQIIVAALYVWSGAQKMNFTFCAEVVPLLLAPVQKLLPGVALPFFLIGICAAIFEALIGVGLLVRRTRKAAVWAAILMHAAILILLIARNYNSIVWIWNAALAAAVWVLFRDSDSSLESVFQTSGGWRVAVAKCVTAAAVLLPILSFCGWWDVYLSGALYSGNTTTAVMRIDDRVFQKLPATAQQSVFRTKNGDRQMLPFFEWAIGEMNVPVYPEPRVYKQIARTVCESAGDKTAVELIVKERPAIFDGNYRVTRIACFEIEK